MNELDNLRIKLREISSESGKTISDCIHYYNTHISNEINSLRKMYELQNKVAVLSSYTIADALMDTLKKMAVMYPEPNSVCISSHLEDAIRYLESGMDAVEMLGMYDLMLYEMMHGKGERYE